MLVERGVLERSLALLEDLCALGSPSGDAGGTAAVAERLRREFALRGLEARVVSEPGEAGDLPVLEARSRRVGTTDGAPLLLLSHLDTVLPARPTRRDGAFLHGSGALDTKGGLAALAGALDLIARRGGEAPADLLLVAVPDEETSGVIAHRRTRRDGATARAVWVLEPGEGRASGEETLVAGRRGLFHWHAEWRGLAAHSGLHYWAGRSALLAAADFVTAAAGLSAPGPGATVNPARLVAGDREFADDPARHGHWVGSAKQINVVPDRARADGEARFLRADEAATTEDRLAAIARSSAARHGVEVGFETRGHVPPWSPLGPQRHLVERARALAADAGWTLATEEDRGGISFPNFLDDPNRVPILDGLGPAGEGMHTREERVSLLSFERRIRLLADLLERAGPESPGSRPER